MIINFRVRGINRGAYKLARTPTLIIIKRYFKLYVSDTSFSTTDIFNIFVSFSSLLDGRLMRL